MEPPVTPPSKRKDHTVLVVVGVLALAILFIAVQSQKNSTKAYTPKQPDGSVAAPTKTTERTVPSICNDVDVSVAVETHVKQQLRSPSTAEFPWPVSGDLDLNNDGTYRYSSHVDAQNGFGATVRQRFVAKVRCEGDRVTILDFAFLEQ